MRRISKWIAVAVMAAGMALAGTLTASASTARQYPGGPGGPGRDHHPRLVCHWEHVHRHHHWQWVRVCHWEYRR